MINLIPDNFVEFSNVFVKKYIFWAYKVYPPEKTNCPMSKSL